MGKSKVVLLGSLLWAWAGLSSLVLAQDIIFPEARRFPIPPPNPQNRLSCFPQDSCQVRGNSRDMLPLEPSKSRSCHCDQACAEYGDCCRDAKNFSTASSSAALAVWDCTVLRNYYGIFLKVACPLSWNDTNSRQMCEAPPDDDKDPFLRLPFTSRTSQLTYRNYYCALCNQDVSSPIFWIPHLECGDRPMNLSFNTSDNFWDHLTYNESIDSWGVKEPNDTFISCTIDPEMPQMVEDMVRRCIPFIHHCASNWTDFQIRERCMSYTTYVYAGDIAYRNWDCAKCNHAGSVSCTRLDAKYGATYHFNQNIFTVLFDVNAQSGQRVGEIKRCEDNEVYDPFVRRCRSIICGMPNQIYRQGRCMSTEEVTTQLPVQVSTDISNVINYTEFSTTDKNQTTGKEKDEQTDVDVVIFPIDENTLYQPSTPVSDNQTTIINEMELTTDTGLPSVETSDDDYAIDIYYDKDLDYTESKTNATTISEQQPKISTKTPLTHTNVPVTTASNQDKGTKEIVANTEPTSTFSTQSTKPESTSKNTENNPELTNSTDLPETTSQILNCDQFELNTNEYELLGNGSVYLQDYSRVLMPHEYVNQSGKLLVCVKSVLGSEYSNYIRKFSSYLSIVALVGLGISLVCLVLHLVAFSMVSDLRNLSGNNLASLCIALILAYSMFIMAQFSPPASTFCMGVGVVMCYSFLSSFFWMNTMAFDVWRALRQATTELRVSSGQQWRKFFVYSAYSWLSPLLIVVTAVVIENIPSIPEDLRPAFGQQLCWFNHRRALLLFFVVPIITIIIINILLFSLSAYMIVSTTHSSAKFHNHKTQRTFRLYMRLALLMGLTWVVGIVAAAADVDPLWYVFVAFNTLQGLFIFFAFTCNKKVLQSVAAKFSGHARLSRKSSTFVDSCSGARLTKKNGLEARDSADSHSSQTSRSSLTQSTSVRSNSVDTLY